MTSSPTLGAKLVARIASVCFYAFFAALVILFVTPYPCRLEIEVLLGFIFIGSIVGSLLFSLIQVVLATRSEPNRCFLKGGLIIFFFMFGFLLIWYILVISHGAGSNIRYSAREMQNKNSIKQCALALEFYESAHGELPPVRTGSEPDENGIYPHSWRVYILPYLEHAQLFEQIRLNEPWDSEWNRQFHSQMPSVFAEPGHYDWWKKGLTSFCLLTPLRAQKTADLGENASRIVLLAQSHPGCWMDPNHGIDSTRGMGRFRSFTPTRTYFFGMYDGSIRTVKGDALTPRDWEKIQNGEYFDEEPKP
ncbi:MAG: DUF1559 domain-containing protein [Thermoguttaceae bacterium]|nr:DUF1559 domain-containing protein [Thermoguttaceae bacterium]